MIAGFHAGFQTAPDSQCDGWIGDEFLLEEIGETGGRDRLAAGGGGDGC